MEGGHDKKGRKVERALLGHPAQCQCIEQVQGNGCRCDIPAVETVGHPACHRHQDKQREKLRDANQPQLECCCLGPHAIIGSRDIIGLPANHHHHADLSENCRKARDPEKAIVPEGEG